VKHEPASNVQEMRSGKGSLVTAPRLAGLLSQVLYEEDEKPLDILIVEKRLSCESLKLEECNRTKSVSPKIQVIEKHP